MSKPLYITCDYCVFGFHMEEIAWNEQGGWNSPVWDRPNPEMTTSMFNLCVFISVSTISLADHVRSVTIMGAT